MARWTQSWITGTVPSGVGQGEREWPGRRLGLPESGPGSVATWGARVGALVVDWALAWLVVGVVQLAGYHPTPGAHALLVLAAFTVMEAVLVPTGGQTLGMRLLGLRVARLSDGGNITLGFGVARALLIAVVVPAVVTDRDRRGLHDRAAGAVVVRV